MDRANQVPTREPVQTQPTINRNPVPTQPTTIQTVVNQPASTAATQSNPATDQIKSILDRANQIPTRTTTTTTTTDSNLSG